MAVLRDRPYSNFNFLVDLGTGNTDGPEAGFEEVILPEVWLEVVEYRNGKVYEYRGVPSEIFNQAKNAESVGSYISQNVKGRYETNFRGNTLTAGSKAKQALSKRSNLQ